MIFFSDFEAALEEAKFCAEKECKIYRVTLQGGGYIVALRGHSKKKSRGVEVGFCNYRHSY